MEIQSSVKKETGHITIGVGILSVIMILVFVLINKWDLSVLWGTLFGAIVSILNFFVLGLTVQKATSYDQKKAADIIRLSYSFRMIFIGVIIYLAFRSDMFNSLALVIPLFFPRITIGVMNLSGYAKKQK